MITGGRIFYICDRNRCPDCNDYCKHTTDKEHAVNPTFEESRFFEIKGDWWERIDEGMRLCENS